MNANKFQQSGNIIVCCSFIWDGKVNFLKISVKDQGIGVTEKEKSELFNPYTVLPRGKKLNPTGVGLSLSISKELCKSLGGEIWLETKK